MILNKRGQNDDVLKWIGGIFSLFVALLLIVLFAQIISDAMNPCSEEKSKLSQLEGDLSLCLSQIQNQTELTQNLNNECIEKVDNATEECNEDLTLNIGIVNSYRQIFIIYHITIALSVILTLNLFKGFLSFELNIRNRKLKIFFKGVRFVWMGVKWIIFIVSTLLILFALVYLLFPNL